MKPQTEAFFEKAHELLSQTETMLGVGLTDAAYPSGANVKFYLNFEVKR